MDETEVKMLYILDIILRLLKHAITWIGVCVCFYFSMQAVQSLAGKTTTNNVFFSLFADLKINEWLGFVIGSGGAIYGGIQRARVIRLKNHSKNAIEDLQDSIRELKQKGAIMKDEE